MSELQTDSILAEIKNLLLTMASHVEKSVDLASQILHTRDEERIKEVLAVESKINLLNIEVDDRCFKILALQQPLAADLRFIIAIIKINTDLERMGDQAVNIAKNAAYYIKGKPFKHLIDLPIMSLEVQKMVRGCLDSFVRKDLDLAQQVLERDDAVDLLKQKIFTDIKEMLKAKPEEFEQGLNLILIARNLEKIGDHATNVAEDVIFAVTGKDVRHQKSAFPGKGSPLV